MSHFKGPDINKALPHFRPNTSFLQMLEDSLRKNGNTLALIDRETEKGITRADILQQSTSVASGLANVGVTAGDYVILCCDKNILSYTLLLGTMFTGATAVLAPIPLADTLDELTYGFKIKGVFCDSKYLSSVKKSVNKFKNQPSFLLTTNTQDSTFMSIINCKKEFRIYEVKDVKTHVPLILFSSGTTGVPKGIQISDIGIQLSGSYFSDSKRPKSLLVATPLFWYSAIATFISSIFTHCLLYLSDSKDVKENLEFIEKMKVETWFTGTGTMPSYINEPSVKLYDLTSLKKVFAGGEVVLDSVSKEFETKVLGGRIKLGTAYGSTECGLITADIQGVPESEDRSGSCGKVVPGVEIKILDDEGHLVSPGTIGEIWIKTLAVTPGYWGRPDLNSSMFDNDGFFRNGDAGYFDPEGNLYLRGRVCDLINFRGHKFSPTELEDIIISHLSVMDVAVVSKPHSCDIHHATAFVVRKPGYNVSENEIMGFVNGKVNEPQKLRGGVRFLDTLPRTIIGKVVRQKLREYASNDPLH
uniref:AMP-dependent synthetase/ligase domain-containing protein n=2 Tax=Homalodisca liturata TaxID=320908 RepID=A0A1B6HLA2_9HEMI